MKNRLSRENCVLVVIDYQERLVPAMCEKEALIDASARLLEGFKIFGMPVLVTEQYPKGLGYTVEEIKAAAPESAQYFEKTSFSAYDDEAFLEAFKKEGRRNVIVMGIEAHVCEEQTVLDMLDDGYNVYVPADCVSSRKPFDRDTAIERMKSAGAVISTYEALLFEILRGAREEGFKQISKLVK